MPKFEALPAILSIPLSTSIRGEIRVPGSKSLTNRALLLAALASGRSQLSGVLHSDDTQFMQEAWQRLGVKFTENPDGGLELLGCGGNLPPCSEEIYVGNAGTAARFLTACLVLGQGTYRLNGNARMQARPIADLLVALEEQGCEITDLHHTGCPPLEIKGTGLAGGLITVKGNKSSQYISALMMAAPYAKADTRIAIEGSLVSRTYVEMTKAIMASFAVECSWVSQNELLIPAGQSYTGQSYHIEGDASSASYFFAMAAITGGEITVKGLSKDSSQGDLGLLGLLEEMGCQVKWQQGQVYLRGGALKGIDVDMNTMSDVAPTLAMVALFAKGETVIRNVGNMRIKECDRIAALSCELSKVGAKLTEWEDGLAIEGGASLHGALLETYDDHRMAMALALIGLRVPGIQIKEPACVAKTFPSYFECFFSLLS